MDSWIVSIFTLANNIALNILRMSHDTDEHEFLRDLYVGVILLRVYILN